MINFYDTFLIAEQPTTCPKCGTRTNFYTQPSLFSNEKVEIHVCLSKVCKFEFVVEFDEVFDDKIVEES
jgi:DNA-directed RNA polymerase subunit M/transcription elongation factor TFIIS